MIDNIIFSMDFDLQEKRRPESDTKRMLCKSHEVDIDGIKIRLRLFEEDFYDFKEKLLVDCKEGFVAKDKAHAWIETRLIGGINKDLLDQ